MVYEALEKIENTLLINSFYFVILTFINFCAYNDLSSKTRRNLSSRSSWRGCMWFLKHSFFLGSLLLSELKNGLRCLKFSKFVPNH